MTDAQSTDPPARPPRARRAATAAADVTVPPADESVEVDRFELRLGALGRVEADAVDATMGAIGGVRAERVEARQSLVGGVLADRVEVGQGIARTVIAREVRLGQSFARTIIAGTVHVDRSIGVGVLLARRVEGNVRTLVDWRGAAAFGAAMGLVAGLIRSATSRRRREDAG